MKLSIVIPVFNQADIVKQNVQYITEYKGDDIEIVISDDLSTDHISEVVSELNDDRIKLCINTGTHGHGLDYNTLYGIENCSGDYILFLRTKDFVISEKINDLLDILKANEDVVFLSGSAIDENNIPKIEYDTFKKYNAGWDALYANDKIYLHPSGWICKRQCIDIQKLYQFYQDVEDAMHLIELHNLIRISLTQQGAFLTIPDVYWIYTNTLAAKSISANVGRTYIYDPKYLYMRLEQLYRWSDMILDGEMKYYQFARIFGRFLISFTWEYYKDMKDQGVIEHYGLAGVKDVDMDYEREKYLGFVGEIEKKYNLSTNAYYNSLKKDYIRKNMEYCRRLVEI